MKEWHVEHMKKIVVKFVTGLSDNATSWEKRQHKLYGRLNNVCRQIEYDIKHGVTNEQVLSILKEIRTNISFSSIREKEGSTERINEVEKNFLPVSTWNSKYY
jgi:hypothetical protein